MGYRGGIIMGWEEAMNLLPGKKMKKKLTPIEQARAFAKAREANFKKVKTPQERYVSEPGMQRVTWGNRGMGY